MNPPRTPAHLTAWGVLLALLVLLAYLPVVRCGFIWDDDALLTHNPNVRSAGGVARSWADPGANEDYYPLIYTSWAVEYALWGQHALGYHIDNVVLHVLNACLLWAILRRLAVPGAWLAAAAWALHPVQVESVAWVSERKNVLSGLFFFLALWCFVRAWLPGGPAAGEGGSAAPPARSGGGRWGWVYALSLLFFVAAMFAKPVCMMLMGVLPLLVWWKRGRVGRRDVAVLAPYVLLALPMAGLTIWVQRHNVGAMGREFAFSPLARCLIAGRVLFFYATKLAWPARLTFAYPKWHIDTGAAWQYVFPLAAAAVVGVLWAARRRLGRAPLAAVLVFVVLLAPALGLVSIYWHRYYFVADHVQYLASAALIALVVAAGWKALAHLDAVGGRLGWLLGASLLLGLGAHTSAQTLMYHDPTTLWRETLDRDPDAYMASTNLGLILADQGRMDEAVALYRQALRSNPAFPEAHNDLGLALAEQGDSAGAIAEYRAALEFRPGYVPVYYNLGNALVQHGELAPAITAYRAYLALKPDDAQAHNNLGLVLGRQGQAVDGIAHLERAVAFAPGNADFRLNLGLAYLDHAQEPAAASELSEVVAHPPATAESLLRLGKGLSRCGLDGDAIRCLRSAVGLDPQSVDAHEALAKALAGAGQKGLR